MQGPDTPRKARKIPAVEASRFRDTRFTCNLTVPATAQLAQPHATLWAMERLALG